MVQCWTQLYTSSSFDYLMDINDDDDDDDDVGDDDDENFEEEEDDGDYDLEHRWYFPEK